MEHEQGHAQTAVFSCRARFTWSGDGESVFAAMRVSLYIGAAAAVICTTALLWKRATSPHS